MDGYKVAAFCLDCWNCLHDESLTSKEVKLSKYLNPCEGYGLMKPVIEFPHLTDGFFSLLKDMLDWED